ncbi:MAG TPA: hypothetical protein VGL81_14520 [Polyangiaceae bacterium]|jgi:hypothetical protein
MAPIMLSFLDAIFGRAPRYQAPRTHQRYLAKVGNSIVDCGITGRDLDVRERERRYKMGIPNLYLEPVGPRVTAESARQWERDQRCSPYDR